VKREAILLALLACNYAHMCAAYTWELTAGARMLEERRRNGKISLSSISLFATADLMTFLFIHALATLLPHCDICYFFH